MTQEKLNEILQAHKLWIKGDSDGERADLSRADLRGADLRGADLCDADLCDADLCDAKNLLSAINFLDSHFDRTENGYIVYKTFGGAYAPPERWEIKPDSIIDEVVNPERQSDCGCGINVAPLQWVKDNYKGEIWKCLIEWPWLAGVACRRGCAVQHGRKNPLRARAAFV